MFFFLKTDLATLYRPSLDKFVRVILNELIDLLMVTQIPNLCGFITYIIRTSLFDETFNSIIFYYIDIILTNVTFNQITHVAKLSKIIPSYTSIYS